ncbi:MULTISPECIES: hypothetical protein [Rhizobium]|uniref:Ribosomal protein L37AE/L43A n=1 Tax=Rhizobium tropici TaxID=398 RepID=A0A6P1CC96_RHITR|nr:MULTISPECIES: hypothetical protein [Rhizobium]AGB72246.1 hypothetical protein RTCIAT899_CH14340 [Rhizobium tropici CIAT 899]MBB4244116.1 ribosomal protein L37AE/L43A [Rhizobium tropici]MBB5595219.1 ribosomal protein L37AE/L43A [Rhizobium tropici]MBB6494511.1 ribosomal protein L37AE/L43A [Rhizobium tropici]NEV14740.1 hypothetical protein [Rhizobium tropici]
MAVTKLEQWKRERRIKTRPFIVGERTHVVEIECDHCSRHFLRWASTAAAYWRCDDCTAIV